uniref:Vacuolar protein sorting-associated protein 11 homolog n=1 Tax=Mesocestoides corti TaxID=53468 RepID=A0A5K3FHI8_MESCO
MSYSRRFAFFEKVPLSVDKVEHSFQDLPVTCVTSGGGYLWLGDADGFMHCLDSTFCLSSFRAHTSGPVRHCRQVPGTEHLVVTVGASSEDRDERVCVWNTKKWSLTSKTSLPVCCRSVKTTVGAPQPGGRSLGEVVCLEVAATLDVVLLGHAGGAVQLIKGDITSDRHCRRLVLHEFAVPVTGLHYVPATPSNPKRQKANLEEFLRASSRHIVEQLSPETSVKSADVGSASPVVGSPSSGPTSPYVFACSESQIVSITLGKRDEPIRTNVLDSFGCRVNCSCLLTDPQKPGHPNLVMAHKEALYFYDVDGRGPCIAIEGDKRAICSYKNYLVSIRLSGAQRPTDSQPGFPDPQSSVSLFEFKNKFIGGDFVIPWAHSIIADLGSLFVLCLEADAARGTNSVKIVELVEKDTQSKLDILFSRKSFNLAIGMAESDNHSKEELAHIHRRYADHLFSQKQYDMAVKEYIQTIGTVEASYVVLRFLESGLINHLTRYLEALHLPENVARGCLTKDHTALLLNSYARLDDSERIDAFLRTLANQPHIDSDFFACINVLRRAGYPHQALTLARLTSNTADCIQILAEDLKDAEAVLAEINALPFEQALEAVCTHGTFLMQTVPVETAEILDKLCSNPKGGRISAQHFIKIFVNNRTGLMKFLERYIQKVHSIDAAVLNSVETLLELALYEADAISGDAACEDKEAQVAHLHGLVMRLLKHSKV